MKDVKLPKINQNQKQCEVWGNRYINQILKVLLRVTHERDHNKQADRRAVNSLRFRNGFVTRDDYLSYKPCQKAVEMSSAACSYINFTEKTVEEIQQRRPVNILQNTDIDY